MIKTSDLRQNQAVVVCPEADGAMVPVVYVHNWPDNLGGGGSAGLTDVQLRAAPVPVSGPLTDLQLRNTALAVSAVSLPLPAGAATSAKQDTLIGYVDGIESLLAGVLNVAGAFYPAVQAVNGSVSISGSVAVTGTFWQNTQPVSLVALPALAAGNALIGKVGIDQSTPGTTNAVVATGPSLTKAAQAATGFSVQNLKDAGRSSIALTAEVAFAQTAETLLTMTQSVDGGATSTFVSRAVTNGKIFRIQQIVIEVETLGSGTAPQRAYLRLRRNNVGATIASSPLQAVWACANNPAVAKTATVLTFMVPDGLEIVGDGTKSFGFTLETPDWVNTTATGRAKITVIGYEY